MGSTEVEMREIVAEEIFAQVSGRPEKVSCDPQLLYSFYNEVCHPQFVSFLKAHQIELDQLSVLDQAKVYVRGDLLNEFARTKPPFSIFRGRFYHYSYWVADATEIRLFELEDEDVLELLNTNPKTLLHP